MFYSIDSKQSQNINRLPSLAFFQSIVAMGLVPAHIQSLAVFSTGALHTGHCAPTHPPHTTTCMQGCSTSSLARCQHTTHLAILFLSSCTRPSVSMHCCSTASSCSAVRCGAGGSEGARAGVSRCCRASRIRALASWVMRTRGSWANSCYVLRQEWIYWGVSNRVTCQRRTAMSQSCYWYQRAGDQGQWCQLGEVVGLSSLMAMLMGRRCLASTTASQPSRFSCLITEWCTGNPCDFTFSSIITYNQAYRHNLKQKSIMQY